MQAPILPLQLRGLDLYCVRLRYDYGLQRLAHSDIGYVVLGVVYFIQDFLGSFDTAFFQLCELKAAFSIDLILDYVFGLGGHGISPVEGSNQYL